MTNSANISNKTNITICDNRKQKMIFALLCVAYVVWRVSPSLRNVLLRGSGVISREVSMAQGFDKTISEVRASLVCKVAVSALTPNNDLTLAISTPLVVPVPPPTSGIYKVEIKELTIVNKRDQSIFLQGVNSSSVLSAKFTFSSDMNNPAIGTVNTTNSTACDNTSNVKTSEVATAPLSAADSIENGDALASQLGGMGMWTMRGTRTNNSTSFYAIEQGLFNGDTPKGQVNCYWVEQRTADRRVVVGTWSHQDSTFEGEWLSCSGRRGSYTATSRANFLSGEIPELINPKMSR